MSEPPPHKKHRQATLASCLKQPDHQGESSRPTGPSSTDAVQPELDETAPPTDDSGLHESSESSITHSHNDIGLAVRCYLSQKDRVRFLNPWRPSSANDFPSSVRQSDKGSKTGVEHRRRLLPQHLDAFPWLAVSRHPGTEGAFCVPCVLFAAGSTIGGTQH